MFNVIGFNFENVFHFGMMLTDRINPFQLTKILGPLQCPRRITERNRCHEAI